VTAAGWVHGLTLGLLLLQLCPPLPPRTARTFALTHPSNLRETRARISRAASTRSYISEVNVERTNH
jgi:hypothetical protein